MERELRCEEAIKIRDIKILFQPIIDLADKKVHGYEALARGIDVNNQIISPTELFERARKLGQSLSLDRLCRLRAFQEYCKFESFSKTRIFVNIDSSVLSEDVAGSKWLFRASVDCNLKPENVVVEFSENKFLSTAAMLKVTESLKSDGFKIALDDFGAAYSNLGRLIDISPDYIKIDKGIIQGIDKNRKKQHIVEALSLLAKRLNISIIAEGIERVEELIVCHKFEINLYQGYLIAYPAENKASVDLSSLIQCLDNTKL